MMATALGLPRTRTSSTSLAIAVLAVIVAAITRPLSTLAYTDFRYDQAVDAGRVLAMWHGVWPAFGPQPLHQPFGLPPLYYYLLLPSSIFGPNPIFQAMPNALLSVCSVVLVMYLVYMLLESAPPDRRVLLAAAAGLWWSFSNVDIQLNNRAWNPSPIAALLMIMSVLFVTIAQRHLSLAQSMLASLTFGAAAAILVSLHGTTLFVTPVLFVVLIGYYIVRNRTANCSWLFPALAIGSFLACLTPYWVTEIGNHWDNTRAIVHAVQANAGTPLGAKLDNARHAYLSLRETMYFPDFTRSFAPESTLGQLLKAIGVLFLLLVPWLAAFTFKGNRLLAGVLVLGWLIYLAASANYPTPYIHYRLPIIIAPLILAVASLAYISYRTVTGRLAAGFVIVCLLVSLVINGVDDVAYLQAKFASQRLMRTTDMISALTDLPAGATVCGSERQAHLHPLMYLDEFIVKRGLRFATTCTPGAYQITPRYVYAHGTPLAADINDDLNVVSTAGTTGRVLVDRELYSIEPVSP